MNDKKYLDITYSDKKTPRTQYPYALGKELVKRTGKTSGKFLDLGCGRGEYLDVFFDMGFDKFCSFYFCITTNFTNKNNGFSL